MLTGHLARCHSQKNTLILSSSQNFVKTTQTFCQPAQVRFRTNEKIAVSSHYTYIIPLIWFASVYPVTPLVAPLWWWYYPTPSEGWGRGGTPRRPNSRATPQGLDHRSRIEREEPKIDLRRGSEAGQSRRR